MSIKIYSIWHWSWRLRLWRRKKQWLDYSVTVSIPSIGTSISYREIFKEWKNLRKYFGLPRNCHHFVKSGAYEQEHATPLYFCHGVFIDRFIFRSNLLWMRLPWECHNQSQDTNWRHCVTGPELPFFHKRKGVLKIDQSVKMPWYRLSMGVASSCSSAPGQV